MIVNETPNRLATSGLGDTANFKINASGFAFKTLSETLYSNKPGSIVRELYSNAYDAHVMAGIPNEPAEIHLPTTSLPVFYVRDYGPGLSHEEITNLYTTLFDSTKRATNDMIGGFGLGSKTPFAYTDQFSVDVWQDGTHRSYACYISEDGTPKITLLTSSPSAERQGMKVSFPVNPKDFSAFYSSVVEQLGFFNPLPNVFPAVSWKVEKDTPIALRGTNWELYSSWGWAVSGAKIIVGQVAYPLDLAKSEVSSALSREARELAELRLVIRVPIGAVEVTASREALSYTKKTLANITAALDRVIAELSGLISKEIAGCSTFYEAAVAAHNIAAALRSNKYYSTALSDKVSKHSKYKGRLLRDDFYKVEKADNILTWHPYSLSDISAKKSPPRFTTRSPGNELSLSLKHPTVFDPNVPILYHVDVPDWFGRVTKAVADSKIQNYSLKVPDPVFIRTDDATFAKILDRLGDPPHIKVSSLPAPPKAVVVPTIKTLRDSLLVLDAWDWKALLNSDPDPNGGYFLYTKSYQAYAERPGQSSGYFLGRQSVQHFVKTAVTAGIIPDSTIYGVLTNGHAKMAKLEKDPNSGWKNLIPFVADAVKAKLNDKTVLDALAYQKYRKTLSLQEDSYLSFAKRFFADTTDPVLLPIFSLKPPTEATLSILGLAGMYKLPTPAVPAMLPFSSVVSHIAQKYPNHHDVISGLSNSSLTTSLTVDFLISKLSKHL